MNETSILADRLAVLESRMAYQDATIDDLNHMVSKQWAEIENLQLDLSKQLARLARIESDLKPSEFDEKPPHY